MIEGQQKRFVFWTAVADDGKHHQPGSDIGQAEPFSVQASVAAIPQI